MKALLKRIWLWAQAIVQDEGESIPFPLTTDEWADIQQHEARREALRMQERSASKSAPIARSAFTTTGWLPSTLAADARQ